MSVNYRMATISIRALTIASKFLLMIFLARWLPVDQVGLYGIITTSIILCLQLTGLDFYAFNTREILKASKEQQAVFIRDQWLVHLFSYLCLFPVLLLAFYYRIMPWSTVGWFYLLLILEHNSQEMNRLLVTLSQPLMANVVLFFRSGLWVFVFFAYAYSQIKITLTSVWLLWAIGNLVALSVACFQLSNLPWKKAIAHPINYAWIKKGLHIAFIFLFGTLVFQLLLYMNRYFIQYWLGLEALGIYLFFSSLLGVVITFAQVGVFDFIVPGIISDFHLNRKSLVPAMNKLYRLVGAYLLAATFIAVLGIHLVLKMVGQPVYLNHLSLFYGLLVGVMITVLGQIPHYALYISYHEKTILRISLITLVFSVITNIISIRLYGLMGAVLANIGTMTLMWFLKHQAFVKIKKTGSLNENCIST